MSNLAPTWVTAFLDLAPTEHAEGLDLWARLTGSSVSPVRGERGEFATLVPPGGDPYLRVQRLEQGPSRIHLDLHVADVAGATAHAVDRGARLVRSAGYATLTSPGGFVFCLVPARGGVRPRDPSALVDQVALDIPAEAHQREVAFWSELTGWELRSSAASSVFSSLERPEGMPLRIMFHQLGEPTGPVRAHLDWACADRAATVARHADLGVGVGATYEHWTVMEPAVGPAYCLTDRDPGTGLLG